MKNVTITLDEDLAAWARVEAAKAGKSLSRYLADVLAEQRAGRPAVSQAEAMERFLSGPGWPGIAENLPSREELYAEREDELLRRYERSRLHGRPGRTGETVDRGELAEKDDQEPYAGSQSAKPE
jgi:hypothetical protein